MKNMSQLLMLVTNNSSDKSSVLHLFKRVFMAGIALSVLILSGCAMPILSEADKPEPTQPFLANTDCPCDAGISSLSMPKTFSLDAVYFHTNKATLRHTAQAKLDAIITAARFYNPSKIIIEGNADNRGGTRYNQRLSARRARAVETALIQGGIDRAILKIQANGESRPVASNKTRRGRQLNRRVDVTLH